MRTAYTLLFYLAIPFILLRLWWRGYKAPAYRKRWGERFGYFKSPQHQRAIWVHAVSLGEVLAAVPLIKELRTSYPDTLIVVTTMTPTGSARIQAAFEDQIFHVYVPYDIPWSVKRFLKKIRPSMIIIMETELWPNIIHQCAKQDIPVFIANARLSERSAKTYNYVAPLMRDMLNKVSKVVAQTQADADRFINLGLDANKCIITGSIKFDIQFPASLNEKAALLRQQWGMNRPIWIAASTHEGEDEIVLNAFSLIKQQIENILLVLVPRHPERFSKVASLTRKQGYKVALRSDYNSWSNDCEAYIGDTLGELTLFYAASDIAFVGGSLVPTGGHNLLEPAALRIPSLTGPHMFNFTEINRLLQEADAVKEVHSAKDLATNVIFWLQDSNARTQAGERGYQVVEQNKGALNTHIKLLADYLK